MRVFKGGIEVARGRKLLADPAGRLMPPLPGSPMRLAGIGPEQLIVPAKPGKLRVIGALEETIFTRKLLFAPKIEDGCAVSATERDLLKIAVYNRYVAGVRPTVGFVHGLGLKKGAVATSIAHDSHNIIAAGVTDADITSAVSALVETGGGMSAAVGDLIEVLPLPIAGLMSPLPASEVSGRLRVLKALIKDWGAKLENPYMALSFLALPVIPELKITDMGLVDVSLFSHVDLFEEVIR